MLIALCGKPSVGKSSFFKAATLASVDIANYPFTTIKSTEGIAFVKIQCVDKDFEVKCNPRTGYCIDGKRFVPIKLMDIPGLIEGSHLGLGRGNEFLTDIATADALIHVIDISGSTNEKGEPVEPLSHDPAKDIKFLENEIDLWILGIIQKGWDKFVRSQSAEKGELYKALAKQLSGLKISEEITKKILKGFNPDLTTWTQQDLITLAKELRKITKPMLIAANKIDIPGAKENLERIKKEFPDHIIIGCSAESELALKEAAKKDLIKYIPGENNFEILNKDKLSEQQQKALQFIKTNILDQFKTTGVQDCLNKAVFGLLEMIAIFPGGVNNLTDKQGRCLPDCFLLDKASTALDFAYKIHQDIGNNFIKAIDVKTKVSIGKDHKLKHRDVIEIKVRN